MVLPNGYGKVIAAMLIWGSVGIFVRLADQPASTIVFVRVLSAFVALGLLALASRQKILLYGHWRLALISGSVLAANWLFFFKAIQMTSIGNAVLTYYMAPIFSILWAHLFLREQLERRVAYALLLAVIGIGLMTSGYEFSLTSSDFVGILYGLTGAFFYSLVVVMAKYMSVVAASHLALVQMGVSTVFFLPTVLLTPPTLTFSSTAAMLTMGVVHSALALSLYFSGLKQVKIQHASILAYIDPVSALVYAYVIFTEIPVLYTILGGLCILLASYMVMRRPMERNDG